MSNIKLKNHNWATQGVYDINLQKTQEEINQDINVIAQATDSTTIGPAAIATFDTSAADMPLKGLTVDIEPVQDLHGYGHPWPGGGGKNLLPLNGNQSRREVTYTVQADGGIKIVGTSTAMDGYIFFPSNNTKNVPTGQYIASLTGSGTGFDAINIQYYRDSIAVAYGKTISINVIEETVENYIRLRAPAQTTFDCVVYPMLRLATETDDTYEPYSNICPITGWTGAKVTHYGANLLDGVSINRGVYVTASGMEQTSATDFSSTDYVPINDDVSILTNFPSRLAAAVSVAYYDASKVFISRQFVYGDGQLPPVGPASEKLILPADAEWLRVNCYYNEFAHVAISDGDIDNINITFPAGTIYGGTLDVVNNKLTADWAIYPLSNFSWSKSSNTTNAFVTTGNIPADWPSGTANQGAVINAISDIFTAVSYAGLRASDNAKMSYRISQGAQGLMIRDSSFASIYNDFTEQALKDALEGHFVAYKKVAPQQIDIDAIDINTLYGTNNIWADTGNITVTYGAYLETVKAHADNKDKTTRAMLAPVEEGSTASANYAIGDMLVFSGKLCKATATIASGDTLAIGMNLTSTTVENELKANYVLPASGIPKADLAADVQKSLDAANASMFLVNGANTSQLFKFWWSLSDSEEGRYARLEKFFILLADSWADKKYTLKWYKASVSSSSVMTPIDDLEGKSAAQLCTDATTPVADWADEDPMTWYVRANALSLADGTMNILAIEGLDDDFDLTGETAPVWTFSMALWKKEWELGDYKYKSWATTQLDENYKPYAGDVDPTTNKKRIMTWRPTFPGSLTSDGTKLTSGAGGKPYLFASAVTAITKARATDAYEGLWNDADAIWVLDMWQLRHFNLENSDICEGCQSYDYSPTIAVAETGVTRVLLTTANAANYQVGSNVSIGTARANNIRTILSKEDVEIGGTTYTALNLDGEAFDTETSQKVFTMPWNSGNTENLPGHKDGACYSLTAGRNPLRVQGVEMMSGAYDIGLDPLCNVTNFANSKGDYAIFECRNSEKLAGSITADYEDTGISYAQMPNNWNYPKAFAETDKAILFPAELGGSTSAYYKSGFCGTYSAGVRCPWRYGGLGSGAVAGLACGIGNIAPSNTYWYGRPRLSGSGKKRGVWTA